MPWPIFPECPTFGFTSIPDYSVTIIERGSGVRTVNRNWYYPLHIYTAVPMGERVQDDIHRVLRFWHAIGGQSGRFLLKDYVDFKSTTNPSSNITSVDQPLVQLDDGTFQLVKVYEDPEFLFTQQRLIQKPKNGTILISVDGALLDEGPDYSIDYDTGIVTIPAQDSGAAYRWGGEFFVPVMFETKPQFVITNKNIQSTEFSMRELRLA